MKNTPATRLYPRSSLTAAGIILRRRSAAGDRWLLLKARKHNEWGFPKGHQDPGETLLATALRECVEESGISLLAIDGDPLELNYCLPNGRPKKVVYFPAITSTETFILSHEHHAARWVTASEVRQRLPHPTLVRLFDSYLRARA